MRTDNAISPVTIYRNEYAAPAYWVETVELGFDLDPSGTHVASRLTLTRNTDVPHGPLTLNGQELELLQLRLNGKTLKATDYRIEDEMLIIPSAPDRIILEIETRTVPESNTSLMGLYASGGNLYTQCEAEGFRKITYFPDRPDVMARFTVMLRADKALFPVLLSNGNLIESGDLDHGRHYAKWEDPFRKPSYLFALVAGQLVCEERTLKLASGREALLQVWVQEGNLDKTTHAMDSLINSIRWDQYRYGLDLDLDRFMIVAVSDFNMGAMENKGLNIFNTRFVLANPETATDIDYANIEAVVGHEYFHNWTGNRVTCRDWFQLSLKEGLTVFRDQEFSADMLGTDSGRAVKRIDDVVTLREMQFAEDAGPMAHPVRPDSYEEINNFYTVTVYEKGAEVVRMYQTLLGVDGFRRGMDLYFKRHDGQAVQCDDFRAAMSDANQRDLTQFERWYSQAGTPRVNAHGVYDAAQQTYTLTLTQSCAATPGQSEKLPFHIPVAVGLLDAKGNDLPLTLRGAGQVNPVTTCVLELTETSQQFVFVEVKLAPVPSLLRGFSAPVRLDIELSDSDLGLMFAHDSDPFNRWEAGQRLALQRLQRLVKLVQEAGVESLDAGLALLASKDSANHQPDLLIAGLRSTLADAKLDPAYRDVLLGLPSEEAVAGSMEIIDPLAIHIASRYLKRQVAHALQTSLITVYKAHRVSGDYKPVASDAGKRALRNRALSYLLELDDSSAHALAQQQYDSANNMTDRIAALGVLQNSNAPGRDAALTDFYRRFENEALVIDKWFSVQAAARRTDVAAVRQLMQHPAFNLRNPNRARSLISVFCMRNSLGFHALDGSGYRFWAEQVIQLDSINPMIAARMARFLDRWRQYAAGHRSHMQAALKQIDATPQLSRDLREIIGKALAD